VDYIIQIFVLHMAFMLQPCMFHLFDCYMEFMLRLCIDIEVSLNIPYIFLSYSIHATTMHRVTCHLIKPSICFVIQHSHYQYVGLSFTYLFFILLIHMNWYDNVIQMKRSFIVLNICHLDCILRCPILYDFHFFLSV